MPDGCVEIESVKHGRTELERNNGNGYLLTDYRGNLTVVYRNGNSHQYNLVQDNMPLIFKTSKNWTGKGRQIQKITSGFFVVVTPESWTRNKDAPVQEVLCENSEFKVHFFHAEKDISAEERDGFEECDDFYSKPMYSLEGKNIEDSSDDGDLFIESVPKLHLENSVVWIRVGDEGGSWKGKNFQSSEIDLKNILSSRIGRFYIRVYEDLGKDRVSLVDSGDFRYSDSLHKILLDDECYEERLCRHPLSTGHPPATLKFMNKNGTILQSRSESAPYCCKINDKSGISICSSPDCDTTTWSISHHDGEVGVQIKLNRIWWRLQRSDGSAESYQAIPLEMSRSKFKNLANQNCVIRLSLGRVDSVNVGYSNSTGDRTYRTEKSADKPNYVDLKLLDFLDDREIDEPDEEHVEMQISVGAVSTTILKFSNESTELRDEVSETIENVAYVRNGPDKWRFGRGFSKRELEKAGIAFDDAKRYGMRIDPNRRSMHPRNIETLERIVKNASL